MDKNTVISFVLGLALGYFVLGHFFESGKVA